MAKKAFTITATIYIEGDIDDEIVDDIESTVEQEIEQGGSIGNDIELYIAELLPENGYIQCTGCDGWYENPGTWIERDSFVCDDCFAEKMAQAETAVAQNDIAQLIQLFGYPLRVRIDGGMGQAYYGDLTEYDRITNACRVQVGGGKAWYGKRYVKVVLG